jgi:hypothetical protein
MMASSPPSWAVVKANCRKRAHDLFPVYDIGPPSVVAGHERFPLLQETHYVGTLTMGKVIDSGAEGTVSHAQLALGTSPK